MNLHYCWGEYGEIEYDYEVSDSDIIDCAIDYYCDIFDVDAAHCGKLIQRLIEEDLLLFEEDDEFIDYLKDQFEDAAAEERAEGIEYARDPMGYYGMHISDFIKL